MGGSALDIEQHESLLAYLRASGRIAADERISMHNLVGGVSNRTVLVQRPGGDDWVLKQALEKLRVAVDWFSSPTRIRREALGMRWLADLAPPDSTTPLIFEDEAHYLLAMQAVPRPHQNWKRLLLVGYLQRDHIQQFGELLGTIHRRSAEQRAALAPIFDDRSFFESLRLEPYYSYAAEQVPAAATFLHALVEETRACRLALVHGDYSPKNVLVHKKRLVLLDHEVIHFGDPAFDVGFSLTHLLSKAHHLPGQRIAFAEAAYHYWQVYCQTLGAVDWLPGLEARAVRHTLACLLARVAGRSPLEYLDAAERACQQQAVLSLMTGRLPESIPALIYQFIAQIERYASAAAPAQNGQQA
jgi:aminoglycoside phosphotransferase (APT) family kinase protein